MDPEELLAVAGPIEPVDAQPIYQQITQALAGFAAEPGNQQNIQTLQGILMQSFGERDMMQAIEEQRNGTQHETWALIRNDKIALLRALHGPYMRFDIEHEYMRRNGFDYNKLSIEKLTLPNVSDGDCLNVCFNNLKTLRISASFIKFHSRVIADMLSGPLTGDSNGSSFFELKYISRSVFRLILCMLYNPSIVSHTPFYFIRTCKLFDILSAINLLNMKEAKHILETGLIMNIKEYVALEKKYSRILDDDMGRFIRMQPVSTACTCSHTCGGVECAKIENPELSVIDSEPGSFALVALRTLLMFADQYDMHILAENIIDVIISNKKLRGSHKEPPPLWWVYKLSGNTCAIIVKKLLSRPERDPLLSTFPIYDE